MLARRLRWRRGMQKTHWLVLAVLAAAGVALTAGGEPKQSSSRERDETPTKTTALDASPDELPPGHPLGAGQKLPPGHPPIDAGAPASAGEQGEQANDSAQVEGTVAEVLPVDR